jgi:large subunit ribosomal protein L30
MGKIKVIQFRSIIGRPEDQKLTIEALGLGRPNWVRIHNDTPQIRGMINKVTHLVKVEDYKEEVTIAGETKPVKKVVKKSAKAKETAGKQISKKKKPAAKSAGQKSESK